MVGQTGFVPSLIIIRKNGRRALCGVAFFFVRKIFLYLCVSFFRLRNICLFLVLSYSSFLLKNPLKNLIL